MKECVAEVLGSTFLNFLTLGTLDSQKTQDGVNNLNSCFQYEVKTESGDKLLNIKVYDKLLDLVGRDGMKLVSTRLPTVLGARHRLGAFETVIKKA